MARKDLSRTVIEGGRSHRNVYDRRQSHRTERASTRAWLDRVKRDADAAEASAPGKRPRVAKEFSDKLGAGWRWLGSQVGRPWSKAHAELFASFDVRTLTGRHILHDHLLGMVETHDPESSQPWMRPEFFVDAHGILRISRWYTPTWSRLGRETRSWASRRGAAPTHRGWWWFTRGTGGRCLRRASLLPASPPPLVPRAPLSLLPVGPRAGDDAGRSAPAARDGPRPPHR